MKLLLSGLLILPACVLTSVLFAQDTIAPVFMAPPANVTVDCIGDVPSMIDLAWSDNVDGQGTVTGADVSDGLTCPETITRTWSYTDAAGNASYVIQTIIIMDVVPPTASNPDTTYLVQGQMLPAPNPQVVTSFSDNCGIASVTFVSETSDNGTPCETITRIYRITDPCGNFSEVTHVLTYCETLNVTNITSDQIQIFPNPTNGIIQIKGIEEPTSIRVLNSSGYEVFSSMISSQFNTIKLNLESGLYLIELNSDSGLNRTFIIIRQ